MSADFDRDQLVNIFVAEAGDDMGRFWKALHPEGKSYPEAGEVAEYHTVGHKLKGAALLYGFTGLGQLGALLEETLERVRDIPVERWRAILPLIREIAASFRSQVERIGRGGNEDPSVVEDFVRRCAELMPTGSTEISTVDNSDEPADDYLTPILDHEVLSYFSPEAEEYLSTIQALVQRLETDPRLTIEARRETRYYSDRSEAMARFLRILGLTLTVIFSLGAIIGAMITMYAAVAHRTAEIGTLRALGFSRASILLAFIAEALLLGLLGGVLGIAAATLLQLWTISTMNWQTFSELTFCFTLSGTIVWQSLAFSLAMGLAGGLLPALRAARMQIVDALRGV